MLVYLVNCAKRMRYSEQPNVLLEKAKHNVFKQFWKFQFHFFQFLQLITCVSWGIPPTQILLIVHSAAIRHSDFPFFSFSIFLYSGIYKNCSYLLLLFFPVFFIALYLVHPSILFYSSFCSLFSLSLFVHFSCHFCYTFFSLILILYSVCFSLMFYC